MFLFWYISLGLYNCKSGFCLRWLLIIQFKLINQFNSTVVGSELYLQDQFFIDCWGLYRRKMWAASCLASCCAACACDACRTVVSGISRRSARIAYCGLFALSLIVSWILREVAAPLLEKIPCKYLFCIIYIYKLNIKNKCIVCTSVLFAMLITYNFMLVRFCNLSENINSYEWCIEEFNM